MSPLLIAILGAECTGKSALAQALAARLQQDTGLRITWVEELLRGWCVSHGRTPTRGEQGALAAAQSDAIEQALALHDVVVADTTSLMTALYSLHYFDDESLMADAAAWHRRAAITLVAAPDLPWQADGILRDGPEVQRRVHGLVRHALVAHALPWSLVQGEGDARVESALDAVAPLVRGLPTPRSGLFSRLLGRNAEPAARSWRCERCDDPDCEHAARQLS